MMHQDGDQYAKPVLSAAGVLAVACSTLRHRAAGRAGSCNDVVLHRAANEIGWAQLQ